MNVFIIHGSFGNPEENWFPWLKGELEKLEHKVFVPAFPTPEGQSLAVWMNAFEEYKQYLDEETIFVGHSLGPAFILNVLEGLNKPVKAAFFVAGFVGSLNNPEFDELNRSFADRVFDWKKIKENCRQFFVFYSDNDPYIPIQKAQNLGQMLDTKPIMVKEAGHFNDAAGYTKFPALLEKIKNLVQK